MSDFFDREMEEEFMEIVMKFHRSENRRKNKITKKISRSLPTPCPLAEGLSGLTRAELEKVRTYYRIPKAPGGGMNKEGLLHILVEGIPQKYGEYMETLDQERNNLIKNMVKNKGVLPLDLVEEEQIFYLESRGIAFPGNQSGEPVLVACREFISSYRENNEMALKRVVKRNEEWTALTHGLLRNYGYAPADVLTEKVAGVSREKVEPVLYKRVIREAADYYEQMFAYGAGYSDFRIPDPEEVFLAHFDNKGIPYKDFSREELLAVSDSEVPLRNAATRPLESFISTYYEIENSEMDSFMGDLQDLMLAGLPMDYLMQLMGNWLELHDEQLTELLRQIIMELYKISPQWALKGHSMTEMP